MCVWVGVCMCGYVCVGECGCTYIERESCKNSNQFQE
jgi:hypothetical protein